MLFCFIFKGADSIVPFKIAALVVKLRNLDNNG